MNSEQQPQLHQTLQQRQQQHSESRNENGNISSGKMDSSEEADAVDWNEEDSSTSPRNDNGKKNDDSKVRSLPHACVLVTKENHLKEENLQQEEEECLFRITRTRGKSLASGGFGFGRVVESLVSLSSQEVRTKKAKQLRVLQQEKDDHDFEDDHDDGDNGNCKNHNNNNNNPSEGVIHSLGDDRTKQNLQLEGKDGDDDDDEVSPAATGAAAAALSLSTTTSTTAAPAAEVQEYLFLEEVLFLHERGVLECYSLSSSSSSSSSKGDNQQQQQSLLRNKLESYQLYGMLHPDRVSFPFYMVYAHLRKQAFRVIRHTPRRREILDHIVRIEQERAAAASAASPITRPAAVSSSRRRRHHNQEHESLLLLRRQLRQDAASARPPPLGTLALDVYQPNARFKRTSPGLPDFYVAIALYSVPMQMQHIQELVKQCQGIPLQIATVSDSGLVVMFGVTDFQAPEILRKAQDE